MPVSVPLETFGGLVTGIRPEDLPEGASPRTYDTDFLPGCWIQRPGLKSVYSYSGNILGPNAAQNAVNVELGQPNWQNPAGILLNDGSFASVDLSIENTLIDNFTTFADTGTGGTWANPGAINDFGDPSFWCSVPLSATGTTTYTPSPNIGKATAASSSGSKTQTTILNGFSNVATTGTTVTLNFSVASSFSTSQNGETFLYYSVNGSAYTLFQSWFSTSPSQNFAIPLSGTTNLQNVMLKLVASVSYDGGPVSTATITVNNISATVSTGSAQLSSSVLSAGNFAFQIPSSATITGISLNYSAYYSGTIPSLQLQFTSNGTPIGNVVLSSISPTPAAYVVGPQLFGYDAWTPDLLSTIGVQVTAFITNGNSTVFFKGLSVTFEYSLQTTSSDGLAITQFGFNIPNTDGILGFGVNLTGFDANGATVSAQLLKNGVTVGEKRLLPLNIANSTVTFGAANDLFGTSWTYDDVNNLNFGVQFIAESGAGTVNLDYVTIAVYYVSSPTNFNWVGTFDDDQGNIKSFGLDANGQVWLEDVTNNPGILTPLTGIVPAGSYADGCSAYNREYITPSQLTQGTGIPLQYAPGGWVDKITQCGPAQAPVVSASQNAGSIATISNIAITSNVVTLTTSTQSYVAGEVVTLSGLTTVTALNGLSFSILGTGLTTTQIELAFVHGNVGSTSETGTITPQYSYPIVASPSGITQLAAQSDPDSAGHLQCILWSAGPGSKTPGNIITIYYVNAFTHPNGQDPNLVKAFNSGIPLYVNIKNAPWGNGTWLVTNIGMDVPPGAEYGRYYFTYQVPTSSYQQTGSPDSATGTYQITQATITTTVPVPGLGPGSQISLAGVTNASWDGVWSITQALNSGTYSISQTALANGVATYTWALISGVAPVVGQLITVTGTLNANGLLNVTDAVIASVTGSSSGTFTVGNFPLGQSAPTTVEQGQASSAGTQFTFDPGAALAGTNTSPIPGNSGGGTLTVVGASTGDTFPIGAGTRQLVLRLHYAQFRSPQPSPPATFTVATGSNYITASQVPVGPPNVVGTLVCHYGSRAERCAGSEFYTQDFPTSFTVGTGASATKYTSSALVIWDNTTTQVKFTFSDAVLLNGEAVDIQGNNRFNQIDMGAPAWCLKYASRMVYGGVQNRVPNFNNLSFDGGYLPSTGAVPNVPLGWTIDPAYYFPVGPTAAITAFQITSNVVTLTVNNTFAIGQSVVPSGLSTGTYLNGVTLVVLAATLTEITAEFVHADVGLTSDSGTVQALGPTVALNVSPWFGNSLYLKNTTGVQENLIGMLTQPAYQDAYGVSIIQPNQPYTVRVTARAPSGNPSGTLVVDVVDSNGGVYGSSYGEADFPLGNMDTFMEQFTADLIVNNGLSPVPTGLLLRVYLYNSTNQADVEIDHIDIYPTRQPVLPGPMLSYVDEPEAVDGVSGALSVNAQNSQACYGGAVIYDQLYLLKEKSMLTTENSPNFEPADWSVHQVSATCGTCGPNAYDYGDEWLLTACRSGVYGFIGKAPVPVSRELQGPASNSSIWEAINWSAGNTIWLRNDLVNRRFYVGVPLPTPNFWLPNAPANAVPTSPTCVLMCNYQGCPTFEELVNSTPVHTTMFGDLRAVDMRRKWSIWQIESPFADFIRRADGLTLSLFFCNGTQTGKIYELDTFQYTDDGEAIPALYTTAPWVGSKMAAQQGLSVNRLLWTYLTSNVSGSGQLQMKFYPETLGSRYPVTCPLPFILDNPAQFDQERRIEVAGQRVFIELSMLGSGGFVEQTRITMDGTTHPWSAHRGVAK